MNAIRRIHSRLVRSAWLAVSGYLLAGFALIAPMPRRSTLEARLAMIPKTGLPVARSVTIHWNDHQVPFIVAESDDDAAFALGLVHAHLRLGQMAVFRRIAKGRVAEMCGPSATDIDYGLRILDFGRAVPAMLASMPPASRCWLDRFVDGVNHYQRRLREMPIEHRILAIEPEPWTAEDVLTFGRLAGSDVTWLVWFNLLRLRSRADWPRTWARLVDGSGTSPCPPASSGAVGLGRWLSGMWRFGSNSLAVAPSRTTTGAAILASDPHLGLSLPNTWLIIGLKSPSYRVVGLMVPGLPLFALGRNPSIAWGGTNMRAAASDLIDVSGLPRASIRERAETITVRWWRDKRIKIRETEWGPIVSDAPQLRGYGFEAVALRWTGHSVSDEVTAFLKVAAATSFEDFRAAFGTFAVPGQNMLYADATGCIGKIFAVQVPDRRGPTPSDMAVSPAEARRSWTDMLNVLSLPEIRDPSDGFLGSANDRPPAGVSVGYFFSPDDRIRRMENLIKGEERLNLEMIKSFQRDVYVESAVTLRNVIVNKIKQAGLHSRATANERRLIDCVAAWDGHYRAESAGALAFELLRHAVISELNAELLGKPAWAAYVNVGRVNEIIIEDIASTPHRMFEFRLRGSIRQAAKQLDKFPSWGDMHRLVLAHPLSVLPFVGRHFKIADYPIGGSTESLMKTAHGSTVKRHHASFGSNARHISDLADLDHNYFVLLGGQDGWLNSSTFADQVPLWLSGEYIRMPLRMDTVVADFPRTMTLSA